jgi:predicted nuclease of predicted toxin-antitoxin system
MSLPPFLLDANLSPKVARYLAQHLNLDVWSLHGLHLGELPDHEVIRMARASQRVIVTLDRDYAEYFFRTARPGIGIIYLDLPNTHRFIPLINKLLETFMSTQAEQIDFSEALVILTPTTATIHYRP